MKLSRLQINNTPMKLLTTIAAVLISISVFSQDYVEYDNGTFTQNGEELSMEQVYDLALLHKAGVVNFRRGNKFDLMYKDRYLRNINNGFNFVGSAFSGFCGGIGVLIVSDASGDWRWRDASEKVRYVIGVGATTGLLAVSLKAFSRITFREGCPRKRDKQFNKVADKLNEAIQSFNQ